jgi:hypothetical protein
MVSRIPTTPITLANQITIRLSSENYIYWRTQIVPILRSNLIFGFVDGTLECPPEEIPNTDKTDGAAATIANPLYSAWHQQDQAILSGIVGSLTEPVIGMVTLATTSHELGLGNAGSQLRYIIYGPGHGHPWQTQQGKKAQWNSFHGSALTPRRI